VIVKIRKNIITQKSNKKGDKIMQKIIFTNNKSYNVTQISAGYKDMRETLIFSIPESDVNFDDLQEIFSNKDLTENIIIEYEYQDEDDKTVIQQNTKEKYIVPISLCYEIGRYLLTLGKQTPQESRIAELEEAVQVMALSTTQVEKNAILNNLEIGNISRI
jgi:hypothetical protein